MAEQTLAASLRPLAAALDLSVTIVDEAGVVLEWNTAAERMYGIPRDLIIGRRITGFFSPSSLMVRRVLDTGQPVEAVYHQPSPGVHVVVSAAPVYQGDRLIGALSVERDVTRIVELTSELSEAKDRVKTLVQRLNPESPPDASDADPFRAVRGKHPALLHAIELARRVAPTEAITLIRGETGVGKELFARGIHMASRRAKGPFVALNCGAIPATLFESELFGYAPGAFTGANPKGQPGKLELAETGTLFLDEVGDLPPEAQVKLLRFLEDRRFYRVGGNSPIAVDVRILVATNRPLEDLVAQGRFRDDLYWRLNVVGLDLPPLRERKEDVAELVRQCIEEFSVKHGRTIAQVEPLVIQALLNHHWPGNVRELRNAVERMVVLAAEGVIDVNLLPAALRPLQPAAPPPGEERWNTTPSLLAVVTRTEREEIVNALTEAHWRRGDAARLLGVSRGTLYNKCKRLGIEL